MRGFILIIILLAIQNCQVDSNSPKLRVAVASSFYLVLQRLLQQPRAQHLYFLQDIDLITGSSGKLFSQIRSGLQVQLFLSADITHIDSLVERNPSSQKICYARGQLALLQPNKPLQQHELTSLVIANPHLAPYGRAAQHWLQQQNLSPKLIFAPSAQAVLQMAIVAQKAAIVPLHFQHFSSATVRVLQPQVVVDQYLVVLQNSAEVVQLVEYLLSKPVQQYLVQLGYLEVVDNG